MKEKKINQLKTKQRNLKKQRLPWKKKQLKP